MPEKKQKRLFLSLVLFTSLLLESCSGASVSQHGSTEIKASPQIPQETVLSSAAVIPSTFTPEATGTSQPVSTLTKVPSVTASVTPRKTWTPRITSTDDKQYSFWEELPPGRYLAFNTFDHLSAVSLDDFSEVRLSDYQAVFISSNRRFVTIINSYDPDPGQNRVIDLFTNQLVMIPQNDCSGFETDNDLSLIIQRCENDSNRSGIIARKTDTEDFVTLVKFDGNQVTYYAGISPDGRWLPVWIRNIFPPRTEDGLYFYDISCLQKEDCEPGSIGPFEWIPEISISQWSKDGMLFAAAYEKTLSVMDINSRTATNFIMEEPIRYFDWGFDHDTIFISFESGMGRFDIYEVDLLSGRSRIILEDFESVSFYTFEK